MTPGLPELIPLAIMFLLFTVFPIWLSLFLRKRYPKRMWIGLLLSFLFVPWGQLYIEKSTKWIFIVLAGAVILKTILIIFNEHSYIILMLLCSIFSSLVMYYRLTKNPQAYKLTIRNNSFQNKEESTNYNQSNYEQNSYNKEENSNDKQDNKHWYFVIIIIALMILFVIIQLAYNNSNRNNEYVYSNNTAKQSNLSKKHYNESSNYSRTQKTPLKQSAIQRANKSKNPTYVKKANLYKRLCDKNDSASCNKLGILYYNGLGVKQNYFRSAFYFRKACSIGNEIACYNFGILYYNGVGVVQSRTKAAELFKMACDKGYAAGCNNLGILYNRGYGVEQNYLMADKLFKKACDKGYAAGCNNLGILYTNGWGVHQSYAKAAKLFEKACENGYSEGCRNLNSVCAKDPNICK